jgi:hypothetical protein
MFFLQGEIFHTQTKQTGKFIVSYKIIFMLLDGDRVSRAYPQSCSCNG